MTLETAPQQIQLTCKGLFTMPNSLSQVPAGSLLTALNVVVDYDGLLSGRRGIRQFGTSLQTITGVSTTEVFQEWFYNDSKLVWFGDSTLTDADPNRFYMAYDSDGLGTWVQTTHPFSPPAYEFTDTYRSAQSNKNIYFTSTTGILKTDAPANALYAAGAPPGLDGTAALTGVSGFMSTNTEVAYRMTWQVTDANNNKYEGTPSTRVVISNTSGGSRNVNLTFTVPNEVTTDMEYEIYRSLMSASGTTEPSDELQLVLSGHVTGADITNRFFTLTDTVPQSELGADLYTNSGQQGISQANNIPPLANDVCFFAGYLIYGAATTQQKFLLSLLSAEPPLGIQVGDTFTVQTGATTEIYTGGVAENVATKTFHVVTGGDPGSDILLTKQSLIRVINRSTQSLVYAYDSTDTSNSASLPGDFVIQEQGISRVPFGVASSRSTAWNPALTVTPTDNPSLAGGGLGVGYCSKFQQPESVPTANTINVGNPSFEWLRNLPLRNSVIVLKADGCFQLTGSQFPFTVTTLDLGTILTAPETATVMSNQVFAYTNQGVVAITETGPGIISRPIENKLQVISSFLYPNFPRISFGTSYETDRKWILSTISTSDDFLKVTICYVYDTITETWTNYVYPVDIWDILESPTEHRLYVCSATDKYPYLFQERKSFTSVDYADIELPITITAFSSTPNADGYPVTVNSTSNVVVGWSLSQFSEEVDNLPSVVANTSVITSIIDATHITVRDNRVWNLTGIPLTRLEQPIAINVIFCPIIGAAVGENKGNPGIVKFFQEIQFFFQNINFDFITFHFSSDFIASTSPVSLIPTSFTTGWGDFKWGDVPWGGGSFAAQSMRTYIPLSARRAHWLNVEIELQQALTSFTFAGIVLTYRPVTTRAK